jgi:hypothetical protein
MSNDPTDLRAQESREAEEALTAKAKADLEVKDFTELMSTPRGRRFVFALLGRTGQYRTSFTSNRSLTDFNEGQRNVGLYYMDLINRYCLKEYVLMLTEHNQNDS